MGDSRAERLSAIADRGQATTSLTPYRTSLIAKLVKNLPAMQETPVQFLGWEDLLKEGKGYPLQYPGLENS